MFSTLVIVRGLLVLFVSPQFAATAGSILQFVFLSAVLCFMMVPTAMGETTPGFLDKSAGEWMPMAWFFGLFETIRGSKEEGLGVLAERAIIAVPLSVAGAIAVTFAGFGSRCARRSRPRLVSRQAHVSGALSRASSRAAIERPRHIGFHSHDPGAQQASTGADRDRRVDGRRDHQHRGLVAAGWHRRTVSASNGRALDSDGEWYGSSLDCGRHLRCRQSCRRHGCFVFTHDSDRRCTGWGCGRHDRLRSVSRAGGKCAHRLAAGGMADRRLAHGVCLHRHHLRGPGRVDRDRQRAVHTRLPAGHTKLKTRWPLYFGGMYTVATGRFDGNWARFTIRGRCCVSLPWVWPRSWRSTSLAAAPRLIGRFSLTPNLVTTPSS